MDPTQAKQLLDKYLTGTCSTEEQELVERWYQTQADDQSYPLLQKEPSEQYAQGWRLIQQQMRQRDRNRRIRWFSGAAAAAVVLFSLGYFLIDTSFETLDNRNADMEVLPGGNRATLTLADGRVVELSGEQEGIAFVNEDIKYLDGSDVWSQDERIKEEGLDAPSALTTKYYLLSTPKGGTYAITLPDGSKVWLNAASTLKYPERFDSEERVVELEGEAYFEVMRSRKGTKAQSRDGSGANQRISESVNQPFRVVTKGQIVEVLGTSFNISAYPEEKETKTTLVEGLVSVIVGAGQALTLSPTEQSILSDQGRSFIKTSVDVSRYTAWRDGLIVLTDADMRTVVKEIERWYDVDFVFETSVPEVRWHGEIPRTIPLAEVLRALEKYTQLRFELEKERRVAVRR